MQSKKARCTTDETKAFLEAIQAHQPDLVVLAGFMKIIDSHFIESLNGKIINLHPSLLPSFPGINSIETAFNFPVKITAVPFIGSFMKLMQEQLLTKKQ